MRMVLALGVLAGELAGKQPPANATPPRPLSTYAGTYASGFYGPASIESQGGRLIMRLGPQRKAFPLRHWSADVFWYSPSGEDENGPSAVTFKVGSDGRATSFVVEDLNADKLGTFSRT